MNNQEAFEQSAKNLIKQGEKSLIGIGCAYRGEKGLSCAIGFLIPDIEYYKYMEDYGIDELIIMNIVPSLSGVDYSLLMDLQSVHDHRKARTWPKYFLLIGKKHNLDVSFLTILKGIK